MIKSNRGSLFARISGRKLLQPRLDMTGAAGHDREAIRRRCRAEKQDLAGRACRECVSFLISDDGRQISEAAVKNCRRDWKTHFGRSGERERERRSNGTESAKAESFFDHNSCLSLYRDLQKYGSSDYRVAFCTLYFPFHLYYPFTEPK